ncbi:uncharacterized protein TRUGW13939_08811 [Talaromyces rugulosus]|uniref:Uncharacterized protein n=1 Tax=Talaromyces rugulosus TaxID=121627 RepID=A0A7H8R5K2_TALRU|nr:uncharacterized protein TRUGW13939_08811 [Talaromyces rugulosus]QKX61659.1 hypothetical protein TRUGW13939_08811 [Talaromyces rugulosus]
MANQRRQCVVKIEVTLVLVARQLFQDPLPIKQSVRGDPSPPAATAGSPQTTAATSCSPHTECWHCAADPWNLHSGEAGSALTRSHGTAEGMLMR